MVDFLFVEMNPAFEVQTGIAVAAASGRSMREVVPGIPDDLIETYAKVVDTGEPAQFEVHVPVMEMWFEARARRVEGDRFAVLFLDATERKRAERRVAASAARFQSLAQSMPNHVWTSSPDGQLDWFNDRVYAYADAAPDSLNWDGWAAMVHPDDIPGAAAAWAAARQAGEAYETEFRLRRYDGAYRWHIARAVPIRDTAGVIESWVGTNTDIPDQKAAETRLGELAETLEHRVEERSVELAKDTGRVAAEPEDGGDRQPDGRRRSRLQQPASGRLW